MLFKKKQAPYKSANSLIQRMSAPTMMLLEAMEFTPGRDLLRVLSSELRDRKDLSSSDLRKMAQELDRHADALERSGK